MNILSYRVNMVKHSLTKHGFTVLFTCPVNPRLCPTAPTIRYNPLFRNTRCPDPGNRIRYAHCLGMTTSDHIELHRTMSDHVCKREMVISKAKPKSVGITFRANKPPGAQLAHYKLGCHKSSIRPRSSVAHMSPTVSKTV